MTSRWTLRRSEAPGLMPWAFFQSQAARLSFDPSDGLRVVATGRVTIYPDRGQYQLRALELAQAHHAFCRLAVIRPPAKRIT